MSLQWPFRQNGVHIALDIIGRLTPVGMSLALVQRTSFERTGQLLPPAVRLGAPYRSGKISKNLHFRRRPLTKVRVWLRRFIRYLSVGQEPLVAPA